MTINESQLIDNNRFVFDAIVDDVRRNPNVSDREMSLKEKGMDIQSMKSEMSDYFRSCDRMNPGCGALSWFALEEDEKRIILKLARAEGIKLSA